MTLLDQLKRDEGLRLRPYRDTVGALTLGYGHNLDATPISVGAAERLLRDDLASARAAVREAFPWTERLSAARRGVLVNMAFNLGLGGLRGFRRMLAAVEAHDYATAATHMLDSKWAGQVGTRAQRLAEQMRSGRWQ